MFSLVVRKNDLEHTQMGMRQWRGENWKLQEREGTDNRTVCDKEGEGMVQSTLALNRRELPLPHLQEEERQGSGCVLGWVLWEQSLGQRFLYK